MIHPIDLRKLLKNPNIEDIQKIQLKSLLLFEDMEGKELLHVDTLVSPYYDSRLHGVVVVFKREKMLIDFVVFDVVKSTFRENISQKDCNYIEKCIQVQVNRFGKSLNMIRPLAKQNLMILRELNFSNKFIEKVVELYPESIRFKLLNPNLSRKRTIKKDQK